jgi:Txe/YoeB family toxin of Txe-Axe toxin-antitoxin module
MAGSDKNNFDALIRALQEQIGIASEMGLDFAVRLLRMALIEVRLNAHHISDTEIEELCSRIERDAFSAKQRPEAEVINLAEVALKRRL